MAKKLTYKDLPLYQEMMKAKEEYEAYKAQVGDKIDGKLEELENTYREKHLEYIHQQVNKVSKIPFNPTAKNFHIS